MQEKNKGRKEGGRKEVNIWVLDRSHCNCQLIGQFFFEEKEGGTRTKLVLVSNQWKKIRGGPAEV